MKTKVLRPLFARALRKLASFIDPRVVINQAMVDCKVDKQHFEEVSKYWRQRGARIGQNVRIIQDLDHINPHLITIGDRCVIGGFILIHGPQEKLDPVVIGDDVYVGWNAIILPGVHIGNGCIVGAGAVVTKSVESGQVIAGNPAKVIRPVLSSEHQRFVSQMDSDLFIGAVRGKE